MFLIRSRQTKEGKRHTWCWVTDIELTKDTVEAVMRGGRCRWHIENQTFNTLKNQGYNIEHNYGHGKIPSGDQPSLPDVPGFPGGSNSGNGQPGIPKGAEGAGERRPNVPMEGGHTDISVLDARRLG